MKRFQLRTATVADLESIRELIEASVRGLQAEDYSSSAIDASLKTVFTTDSRLIADGTYFVAFNEAGVLAGCGGWSKRRTLYGGDGQMEKIESELLNPEIDAAKVRAIFVHPRYARMGLGSLILQAAEDAARHAGFCRFEMGSTLTGLKLYTLRGYREIERVQVPVSDGETIEVVKLVKEII